MNSLEPGDELPRRPQFSLGRLLAAVSLVCLFLVIPGGAYLLGFLAGWLATGLAVMVLLIGLQLPGLWLLRAWLRRRGDWPRE